MDKVITYNFSRNLISAIANYLKVYLNKDNDFGRIAVVFAGKRPALFLKKELSNSLKSGFIPPRCFSIDEFIQYIVSKESNYRLMHDLEASYLIYKASGNKTPFSQFLPWAREIADFINELDLEGISSEELKGVEASAEIGYAIPKSINDVLKSIVKIRRLYHGGLRKRNIYSRGLLYAEASELVRKVEFDEFDKILFCNFYYLHKTEANILKHLYDNNKAIFFFQRDERNWPVLKEIEETFGFKIEPQKAENASCKMQIYKGFDTHSQVGLVREILLKEILEKNKNLDKTLILLSSPDNLLPLLSEIPTEIGDFNISLGYPLKHSSLYNLIQYIFNAQKTRKDSRYYSRHYLKTLCHPLIKNLLFVGTPVITRVLVHKIEEVILGMVESVISGSIFVELDDIEGLKELYRACADTLAHMDIDFSVNDLKKILIQIHGIAFRMWEDINSFSKLAVCLERFCDCLINKSLIENYPLNIRVVEKIYALVDELNSVEFKHEHFAAEEIFKIFNSKLEQEVVSFLGSPLSGLQILGLLETRALSFENIIVIDANENVLPKLRVYEPLIPEQIMKSLGLKRLKQEEEIQRYHFMRLIGSAKNIYFIYDDNPEKERSRFLEEIIWNEQVKKNELNVFKPRQARFNLSGIVPKKKSAKKNQCIIEYLKKEFVYSASSIDTYLTCPLKFYYQYVLCLKEKEDLLNEPEGRDIGDFMHKLLASTFRRFLGKKPVIDEKFRKDFFLEFEKSFAKDIAKRMVAWGFMVRDIMKYRLKKFLENESLRQVKKILSLEEERPVETINLGKANIKCKYRIDRIDMLEDDSILIIDYKTGSPPKPPAGLERLEKLDFEREKIKNAIHSFQLPIYYYFVREKYKGVALNAMLYSLREIDFIHFLNPKKIDTGMRVMEICLKALEALVNEIINPELDFEADESNDACKYCEFSKLCQ